MTPVAGTTRDVIELTINIGGYPVLLADTAGLRETSDDIEKEGINRAQAQAKAGEIIILMIDAVKCFRWLEARHSENFIDFLRHYVDEVALAGSLHCVEDVVHKESVVLRHGINDQCVSESAERQYSQRCILVLNKIDLLSNQDDLRSLCKMYPNVIPLSCKTEHGFQLLLERTKKHLASL